MNELKIFENKEFGQIRVIDIKGDIWFVAKDVCECLDIKNTTDAIKRLDEDERTRFNLGRQGETNVVNEYGLYNLILGSRKKEAKAFKRWITHEVIPSIRRTGSYSVVDTSKLSPELQALTQMVQVMTKQELRLNQVEDKLDVIESNVLHQPDIDWRRYVNKVFRTIGQKTGDFKTARHDSYEELERRGHCRLQQRLDNLKARAINVGKSMSYIKKLNYLDVLEDEPRLREIYLTIVREYAIKYGVDIRQPKQVL